MLIGARTGTWAASGGGGIFPYPQEGLVCCFDGIWNGGIGVHKTTGTTWTDISGNGHDATWGDDSSWFTFESNHVNVNRIGTYSNNGQFATEFFDGSALNTGMTVVLTIGKSFDSTASWSWPYIISGVNDALMTGTQNYYGNGSEFIFGVSPGTAGTFTSLLNCNTQISTYTDKTLTFKRLDKQTVYGPQSVSAGDFSNVEVKILRNIKSRIYAFMIYSRAFTTEESDALVDIINARFGLT